MKTVRLYVQTAINLQRKCLGTPDCKSMENILIDFTWLNVQAKYLIQTILYHFKWDIALWKWPKCPQYMQRTWWQTVATQHTGLAYAPGHQQCSSGIFCSQHQRVNFHLGRIQCYCTACMNSTKMATDALTPCPGGGTPSLKVVGRLPGTHGLKSLWAPKTKKGGQNSMCCRRAKK